MEKVDSFPDMFHSLFGVNIEDMNEEVINEFFRILIRSGHRAEAFLLAQYQYKKSRQEADILLMEEAASCRLNFENVVRNSGDEDSFISRLQSDELFLCTYSEMLRYYCTHPRSNSIMIIFLLAEKRLQRASLDQIAFINRIDELRYCQKPAAFSAWTAMYTYTSHVDLESAHGFEFLGHLIHKLTTHGFGSLMPLFYWYHSYLGNMEIAGMLFDSLGDDAVEKVTQNPFTKGGYLWARETQESFERRYSMLSRNPREIKHDLRENALSTLVPLCLYAKERGDIETEAQLLLVIMMNNKLLPGLVKRMHEICGRQIPSKFDKLKVGYVRDKWISDKVYQCDAIVKTGRIDEIGITSCKKLYPFKAFDSLVIRALIKINVKVPVDDDVLYVIKLRIGRTTAARHLCALLNFAVMAKSRYSVKLILLRLFILGYLNSILKTAEIIKDQLDDSQAEQWQVLSEVLDFYSAVVSEKQCDLERFGQLRAYLNRFGLVSKDSLSEQEKGEIEVEKKALKMAERNEYTALYNWIDRDLSLSPVVLEMMLKAAIRSMRASFVLLSYRRLALVSASLAGFYSLEVGPYFHNQKTSVKEPGIGTGNLVSTLWNKPTYLTRPINRLTLRIVGYSKDTEGPVKQKLRF